MAHRQNRLAEYAVSLGSSSAAAVHEPRASSIRSRRQSAWMNAAIVSGRPGAEHLRERRGGKSSIEWATFVNGSFATSTTMTPFVTEPAHPSDNLAVLSVGNGGSGRE